MVKGTRALVVGLVGAVVLCSFGYFRNWQYEHRMAQAIERCDAEGAAERKKTGLNLRLLCNVFEIDEVKDKGDPLVGVQKEIADLLAEGRSRAPHLWYAIGALFLVVLAIPYLWYFLLRRLREVRDAVTGQGGS